MLIFTAANNGIGSNFTDNYLLIIIFTAVWLIFLMSMKIVGYQFGLKAVVVMLSVHLSFNLAASETYTWGNVKIGGGGFVTGIIMSASKQNLIYARTDVGGAYRWDEDGQRWISLLDWTSRAQTSYQGVESIAIDPGSPNKVYMLVGTDYWNGGISAVLRSDDYGNTFSITNVTSQFRVHGNGMGRQTGEKLAVDPNKGQILFCGTRNQGLFTSGDEGGSWTKVTAFPAMPTGSLTNTNGISSVVFDPNSGAEDQPTQRIFVSVSRTGADNLYVSEDAGISWSPVEGAINNLMPHRMIFAHGHLYITYTSHPGPWDIEQNKGAVYRYAIETKEWQSISPETNIPYGGISVSATDPSLILVSTINRWHAQNWVSGQTAWGDRMYRSTNGGESWTELFSTNRMTLHSENLWDVTMALHWTGCIEIDPFNADRVFAISGNGIFMTNNLGNVSTGRATWFLQCDGLEETVPLGLASLPGGPLVSVIGDYDGFVHQDPSQVVRRHRPSIGSSTGVDFAQNKPDFVVRSGGNDQANLIFYSENKGSSWTAFVTKPVAGARSGQVAVSADATKVIWKPDGVNNTFFTANKGTTWQEVTTSAQTGRPISDRVDDNVFYSFANSMLSIFTFNIETGNFIRTTKNVGSSGSNLIRPVPNRAGEVWIACGNGGLRRYLRETDMVESISSVQTCQAVGFGKAPAGKDFPAVYIWGSVGGVEGIFRSDDEGGTWIRINDDMHQYGGPGNGNFVTGDANVFGRVYMSTVGRGIVMGSLDGETVDSPKLITGKSGVNSNVGRVFNDQFVVDSPLSADYFIYAMSGMMVDKGRFSGSSWLGGSLKPGMYILIIQTDNKREMTRILKTG
jgi:xyloglucan-specific exo-beta-1,4-glucanase